MNRVRGKQSIISARIIWAASLTFGVALLTGCGEKPGMNKAEASSHQTAASLQAPANNINISNHGEAAAAPSGNIREPVVIPSGRTFTVRLLQTLNSRTATAGQHFNAELAAPIVVDGHTVLPRGTPLRGRVVAARPSGRLHNPGFLRLTLSAVQTPAGQWVDLRSTSISANGKSHKKRNLALIGGGTGVGAIVGAIAGGGKGAAIGAASGAGAGTAGAYATGRKDVAFSAEHRLSFRIVRDLSIG